MYQEFIARGVILPNPNTVTLEVSPAQIAPGAEILPGCHISGTQTSIGPGSRIGTEGPVRLDDCQLGNAVTFASGFAQQATMLDGVSIGANAHIRPGSLLEEYASIAHCVGLKQTMLMPYATLGSLINFCDCLLAGGTGKSDHSEVGSSFVHFNFTPRQDKATPSLFGDVPSGVLLDQPPIFLGGQCGVVGPVRVAYGCVLAAGSVLRRDATSPNTLLTPKQPAIGQTNAGFDARAYGNIDRVVRNNCIYIGNIHALYTWYKSVRAQWQTNDPFSLACQQGAMQRLQQMMSERTKQLTRLADKLSLSPTTHPSHARFKTFIDNCEFTLPADVATVPEHLQRHINKHLESSYIKSILSMPAEAKEETRAWLQAIVNNMHNQWEQTEHE